MSYISQIGSKEEVVDENKTFRELNPFLNILKFNLRTKDLAQYMFKRQVGQLIGMDMKKFDKLMSCEVNDFRWRMRVFANRMAQERRSRLKSSLKERIMYQYPARLAMNGTKRKTQNRSSCSLTFIVFKPTTRWPNRVCFDSGLILVYQIALNQNKMVL